MVALHVGLVCLQLWVLSSTGAPGFDGYHCLCQLLSPTMLQMSLVCYKSQSACYY